MFWPSLIIYVLFALSGFIETNLLQSQVNTCHADHDERDERQNGIHALMDLFTYYRQVDRITSLGRLGAYMGEVSPPHPI